MKTLLNLLLLLLLVSATGLAQEKLSTEEKAIKQVIEDETRYFMQRNYDKWAECVAHDPMTYYTWTTPFTGENAVFEAKGWEAVSKAFKGFMEKWPASDEMPKKENYKFKVNGNMAYVTFNQDRGSEETRVLEKKNGQWRILRMEALASEAFTKMHQLYALQRMAGTWEIMMNTYKKEGGGDWTLQKGTMQLERTPTGLMAKEVYHFLTNEGEDRISEDFAMYCLDMGTGKIGVFVSTHYPHSNWMTAHSSEGQINSDGALVCTGKKVGSDKNKTTWSMKLIEGMLHWEITVKDQEGKQVYASSCSFRKAGEITASSAVKP